MVCSETLQHGEVRVPAMKQLGVRSASWPLVTKLKTGGFSKMYKEDRDPRQVGYADADTEKTQGTISQRDYDHAHGRGEAARAMSDEEILAEFFRYHSPTDSTIPKYQAINQAAKNFAEVVLHNCPKGADRSAAIRLIRDARMTANGGISLNGLSL